MDGYQTEEELVRTVKSLGQNACAISDHGSMRGVVKFYKECKANDIKPLIGCEFYFSPDVTIKDKRYHLLLIAMNNTGYHNLKLLDTIAYQEDHYYIRPRIDEDDLRAHSEGLVCLTACMASIVNTEVGEEWLLKFKEIFGDRLFAEIQPLNLEKQQVYNGKIVELARKHGVPLVVTTDAHYSRPEDEKYHQLWTMIHGFRYDDYQNYLWSEEEIRSTKWIPADTIEEAVENTQRIADMCDVTIETEGNHFPKYPTENATELVKKICRDNWRELVPHGKYQEYAERFNYEIRVLEKLDYLNYMLIVWDFLNYCKDHEIPTGYGRGSASGCLVGYLMRLHKIDPIKYGTEFFRFANEFRVSVPDVDTDVSRVHRGEIIEYIKRKYGTVTKVSTLNYTKNPEKNDPGKAAVLKAVQALGNLEKQQKGLREPEVWTHKKGLMVTKGLQEGLEEILTIPSEFTEEERKELLDVASHFCGRVVNIGCHASAVLVTPDAVENYCPIEGAKSAAKEYTRLAGYEYHTVEAMGVMKLDVLGLNTLDIISDAVKYIKESQGISIDVDKIEPNDPKVFDVYAKGETSGVFQMESPGMRKLAQAMHVSSFDDIVALVALYRPGPLDSGMTQQYVDGKNGKEIEYPNEAMRKNTSNTFGVIVYQEQLMRISMDMCRWDLGQADLLRKVVGRKEVTKIAEITQEFIRDAVKHGETQEVAEKVAEQVKAAGRYIFNRSHAVSYGMVSYITAYLKSYYPREYLCAILNSKDDQEKSLPYIKELKRLKIPLLPPDLSVGNRKWKLEPDGIRMGLEYIKGVGKNLKTEHVDTFESVVATNTKTCVIPCIKAGALDYLGIPRGALLANFATTQDSLKRVQQCQEKIQQYTGDPKKQKLLESWQEKLRDTQEIQKVTPEKYDVIAGECEVLSFSFHEIPKVKTGKITNIYTKNDKNGREMAWLTFSSDYGDFRCTVFADGWQKVSGVAVGETYKFVVNDKGILEELQMDGKVIRVNERRKQWKR